LYDKVLVVDEEVEGDHIVVHQLNHTHKLSEVIHPYGQHQYTKAVVVLNTNNSLTLEPFHLEGFRGIGFPVLIISQRDGKALLDITNENDHIFCDVLTADSMKHQQQQLPPISGSGAGSGGFKHMLKSTIKKLLFDEDPPSLLRIDSTKFTMVMSAFYNYEQLDKPEINQVKMALNKIKKHLEAVFYINFPFFIILAYRIDIKSKPMYNCDESREFIRTCVEMMEDGSNRGDITTALTTFVREDFEIMFNDGANSSSFMLFHEACVHFCQMRSSEMHNDRFLYSTIMWLSLALKVKEEGEREFAKKLWKSHLLSRQKMLKFNEVEISALKRGIMFGKYIELPSELELSSGHMTEMLVASVRRFKHLR
jgi:hypothetical protein